jgi:hypothetical protein
MLVSNQNIIDKKYEYLRELVFFSFPTEVAVFMLLLYYRAASRVIRGIVESYSLKLW